MTILDAAKKYVKFGFSVIPLKPRDKRPAIASWKPYQERKPTDPELTEWFETTGNNIGIVTGKISGVTVLDCDSEDAVREAIARGLPDCPSVATAKGQHFYFSYAPGVGNFQAREDLKGMDLRGDGGYVVAPPSIHPSGIIYKWMRNSKEFFPLCDWVFAKGNGSSKPKITELYKGADAGRRNMSLARLAGVWVKHLSMEESLEMARTWNEKNQPRLGETELATTIASIWQKEHNHSENHIGENEIVKVSHLFDSLFELYESGWQRGKSTGWDTLDQFYTVRKGEWTLVTGIPGHGKTEFTDCLATHLILREKWKFGIFNAENLPHQRHLASFIEKCRRQSFDEMPDKMDSQAVAQGCAMLSENLFFINPNENYFTLSRILKIAGKLQDENGLDAIVIDPWNELDHERPAGMSETEYISQCLSRMRRFARERKIHIFLIAHPTKLVKTPAGKYPVPTPYDVSGSSHWRNKADNCISIWYDYDHPGITEIHVQKVRFKEIGKVGSVKLNFDVKTGTYTEL